MCICNAEWENQVAQYIRSQLNWKSQSHSNHDVTVVVLFFIYIYFCTYISDRCKGWIKIKSLFFSFSNWLATIRWWHIRNHLFQSRSLTTFVCRRSKLPSLRHREEDPFMNDSEWNEKLHWGLPRKNPYCKPNLLK